MALEASEKKTRAEKIKNFYERIKSIFKKIDGMRIWQAWLLLLGVAAACMLVVYLPFAFRGTYTVWTESAGDAATQGVTFLRHVKEMGWLKAVGSYDFYLGLGADYLTSYSFFSLFDPFNLVFFILPFGDLMNYTLTMALKHLTCAVVMFAYLKYKSVSSSRAIVLSVAYMLTGFVAFTFVRHYNLTAGPIYFPLAIMGVEKLFRKERPFLFIGTICLCLLTNFYVFFSLSVFVVAFSIGYYFHDSALQGSKRSVGNFFAKLVPVGLYYLLGVALAGFMLLPNFYGYLNAARSASKGVDLFAFEVFLTQLVSLTLPIPGKNYSSMFVNFALAALTLFALFKKNKKTRIYGIFVIVLTIGYLLPVFGFAMNIFNYSNNRWSYGLSFFLYALIGLQSRETEGEEGFDEATSKKINISFIVYVALMAATALPALVSYTGSSAWWYLATLPIAVGVGFGAYKLIKKTKNGAVWHALQRVYKPTALFALSLVLTVVHCLGFYCVYAFQHNGKERYATLFSAEEKYVAELVANRYPFGSNLGVGNPSSPSDDYGYFRTDTRVAQDWYMAFTNRGVNNGYCGTSAYNSVSNKYVYEFLKENGVYNPAQNLGMSGLDGRFALQSLLSVRYAYDTLGVPYGFTKSSADEQGYDHLYENDNYMPMGFVTDKVYSREYYLSLPTLDRQYLLLDGVVLDEDGATPSANVLPAVGKTTVLKTDVTLKKGAEKLTFSLNAADYAGKELYVIIRDMAETDGLTFFDITVNGARKEYYCPPKGNLMYSDQRSGYLNFGVQPQAESGNIECSVALTKGPSISFKSLEIYAVEASAYDGLLSSRTQAQHLTGVTANGNSFKGSLQSDKAGYMLLTLPYSKGWTAYVDGKPTEIYQADTAFMAIKVGASDAPQTVEFRYETPLLKEGALISYGGLGILGGVLVADTTVRLVKKYKRKKEA